MPTLLDTPEFAAAKDALSTTLEHVEKARQDRLKFLQDVEIKLVETRKQ